MLLATNQGIEVTPQVLLQFIAERTRHSPRESPGKDKNTCVQQHPSPHSSPPSSPVAEDEDVTLHSDRGRELFIHGASSSRSSSRSSGGTSCLPSRPPSVPPKTPVNAPPSAFDTTRRQRTTPLAGAAPSSWTRRPAPASRRKSLDGGSNRALSDTEVMSYITRETTCSDFPNAQLYSHPSPRARLHLDGHPFAPEPLQIQPVLTGTLPHLHLPHIPVLILAHNRNH